jgi:aspartokinase
MEDINMIEDTEIIAVNSHENVLRIHSHSETLQEAVSWLRSILSVKNIALPQVIHSEKVSDGIDVFLTGPSNKIISISKNLSQQVLQSEGFCSLTYWCRGSTRPELLDKIVNTLEQNKIKIMYMSISAMSVTVFIKPAYRIQAFELLHNMIKAPKGF